jgi:hypothetical protein
MPTPNPQKKQKPKKEWKLIDLNQPSERTRLNIARFIYGLAEMAEEGQGAEGAAAVEEDKAGQKSA